MQFLKDMITLNPKDFGGADIPIGLILLCFAVGMILATVVIQIANATVYRMIKALVRHKCTDEGSAKSLKELRLSDDRLVLFALRHENPVLLRHISIQSTAPTPKNADLADGTDGEAVAEMAEIYDLSEKAAEHSPEASAAKRDGAASEAPKQPSFTEEGKQRENAPKAPIEPAESKFYLSEGQIDRARELLSRGEGGVLQTAGLCGLLLVLYFGFAALATWLLPMLL